MRALPLLAALFFAACGTTSSHIAFREEAPREKDGAILYIYRLPAMVGKAVKWKVRLDGTVVAVLKQKAYVALHITPGLHTITIGETPASFSISLMGEVVNQAVQYLDAKARANGTFTAAPGQVYFLRSKGFAVDQMARDDAMREIVDMKLDMGL